MDPDLYLEQFADCTDLILAMVRLRLGALHPQGMSSDEASELVESLGRAQRQIAERLAANPELGVLEHRLGLTETELFVVWLLAAAAARSDVRTALAQYVAGTSPDPSLDVVRSLVYGERPSRAALVELGPSGKLRGLALIERSDGGGSEVHESRQTWAISRRVLALLHGELSIDPAIAHIARESVEVDTESLAVDAVALASVRDALQPRRAIVVVAGMPGLGRQTLLSSVSRELRQSPLVIDARTFSADRATMSNQCQMVARDCLLLDRIPLITNLDALVDKDNRTDVIGKELVSRLPDLVMVTTGVQRPSIRWDRPVVVIDLDQPTTAQRAKLWRSSLGQGTDEDANLLAGAYPLAPALIVRAAEAAKLRARDGTLQPHDIFAGITTVFDDRIGECAKRVRVTQTWDDLVLPAEQVDAIVELTARVRERRQVYEEWGFAEKVGKGLGVSALFSGPPGTGKTMVAALIAKDLGLELYQADLAKIASKWIGETEKNLAALFDAAEAGHAVLLFDEADALFGKRTDVRSSNDRHANFETNYLLQRLENYTGVCILTSNHEANIDPAFQRRLALQLRFQLPEVGERKNLWKAMLPEAAPVAPDVDFDALATRYVMSGGYIRNAALRAAFLAANDRSAITTSYLDRAAKLEYEGMGKIVS